MSGWHSYITLTNTQWHVRAERKITLCWNTCMDYRSNEMDRLSKNLQQRSLNSSNYYRVNSCRLYRSIVGWMSAEHVPVYSRYRHGNPEDRPFPQLYKCTDGSFVHLSIYARILCFVAQCTYTSTINYYLLFCASCSTQVNEALMSSGNITSHVKKLHASKSGLAKELIALL